VRTEKVQLPVLPLEGPDAGHARKGQRPVYWNDYRDYRDTPIFTYEALRPGNAVQGPAVVESEYTTIVVPPATRFSIDDRGLGVLENVRRS
jgi:N-methylhydantoinase A/oxoprolinase/acetone carboxylase beta subunit